MVKKVYLPKEILSNILSYIDYSKERHRIKQDIINNFFDNLQYLKKMNYQEFIELYGDPYENDNDLFLEELQNELFDYLLVEFDDNIKRIPIIYHLIKNE